MLGSGKLQALLETREQKEVGLQESSLSQLSSLGFTGFVPAGLETGSGSESGLVDSEWVQVPDLVLDLVWHHKPPSCRRASAYTCDSS